GRFEAELSTYPCLTRRTPLHKWLRYPGKALSLRATKGFLLRTDHSSLRFPKRFLEMLRQHKEEAEAATHA
ncbi:MAG: DNA (cytosine-5-)-methyltransferase, partial [Phycisphaerae bacterium]